MTYETYEKIREGATAYANAVVRGSRNQHEKIEELVAITIMSCARERRKSSRYVVYRRKCNYGTHKYPWIVSDVEVHPIRDLRETAYMYVGGCTRIHKDSVIGWLS